MHKFLLIIVLLTIVIIANAQIIPTQSPYYQNGSYTVVADSEMTAISKPLLFYYPQTQGAYPVFMFQLGANGFGSTAINRHTYDLFLKHLASYGFVVIVIDNSQAGFPNGSVFIEAHDWYKTKCQEQGYWLNEYADIDKFVVGGHSNGGVNASAILVDRPTEIHGIVFMDSYPSPGTMGIGVHDVSGYTGKVLSMAADENVPDTYRGGYEQFESATCKTFVNVEGLNHGGFGDYEHETQTVGSIGRDSATGTIRHYLVSWFLSEFSDNYDACLQLTSSTFQPNTTKEFLNDCGHVAVFDNDNNISCSIFPNPTSNVVYISFDNKIEDISIYNSIGQKVIQTKDFDNNNTVIDIQTLPKGLYHIRLKFEKTSKTITQTIIKN